MKRDYTFYNEAQNAAFDFMVATIKDKQISCREDLCFKIKTEDDGSRDIIVWEEYETEGQPIKSSGFFATELIAKANALELSSVIRVENGTPLVRIWNTIL